MCSYTITKSDLEAASYKSECSSQKVLPTKPAGGLNFWQLATLFMMMIASFSSSVTFSCIVPFYPIEARSKGLSTWETGVIIGVFQLVMLLFSPLVGRYMAHFGCKRIFSGGLLISGVSSIAFGGLKFAPNEYFFYLSLFIRCVQALGNASFVTTSMAICASCFPGKVSRVMGLIGTFNGLGYTMGPLIGSALYEGFGFHQPFFLLGTLLIFSSMLSTFAIRTPAENEPTSTTGNASVISVLRIWPIWFSVFAIILYTISVTFFDASLTTHLESFDKSSILVAFVLALLSITYLVSSPLWGYALDRWHCYKPLVLLGSTTGAFSTLIMGPAPFLGLEKSIPLISASFAVLGISESVLYISTFHMCLAIVKKNGFSSSVKTYGCISGLIQSSAALGSFIGACAGGLGSQVIGFPNTALVVSVLYFIFSIFFILYVAKSKCTKTVTRKALISTDVPFIG